MGLIYANIELVSPEDMALFRRGYIQKEQIKKESIRALVESGDYILCINEHIRTQLDLPFLTKMEGN